MKKPKPPKWFIVVEVASIAAWVSSAIGVTPGWVFYAGLAGMLVSFSIVWISLMRQSMLKPAVSQSQQESSSVDSNGGLPNPGYYPDPENPGMERWWNGQGWSDARRPRN